MACAISYNMTSFLPCMGAPCEESQPAIHSRQNLACDPRQSQNTALAAVPAQQVGAPRDPCAGAERVGARYSHIAMRSYTRSNAGPFLFEILDRVLLKQLGIPVGTQPAYLPHAHAVQYPLAVPLPPHPLGFRLPLPPPQLR